MTTKKIPSPNNAPTRTQTIKKRSDIISKSSQTKKNIIWHTKSQNKSLPVPPSRSARWRKTTIWWKKIAIIILTIITISIVGLLTKDRILSYLSIHQPQQLVISKNDDVLFVGKDIKLTGILQKTTSKKLNYTHTMEDPTYGILWLRSSIADLNTLSGNIKLQGKIIDFSNNIYIVDVTYTEILSQDQDNNTQRLLYFSRPWLLIQNMKSEWFSIKNQESTGTSSLIVRNSSTNAQVTIRYFACSTNQAYDCNRFQKTFESTVGIHFTDSYKNKFYKLKDANTRFVNLDNRYGVYIETSSESLLTMIIKNIQFITNERSKTTLTPLAKTLCIGSGYILNEITEGNISYEQTNMVWNIQWVSQNYEPMTCSLAINPLELWESSLVSLWKKQWTANQETIKLTEQETPQPTQEKPILTTNNNISPSNTNSVAQIPLKPGKELLFSTKGLSISFPSPNIAFESSNSVKKVKGLSCTTSTNVTLYSNKINIKTNPSIVMYFCKNGSLIDTSNVRTITTTNTTILIEILDLAWIDFVNWIKIN
jgi:hypothetical protein